MKKNIFEKKVNSSVNVSLKVSIYCNDISLLTKS